MDFYRCQLFRRYENRLFLKKTFFQKIRYRSISIFISIKSDKSIMHIDFDFHIDLFVVLCTLICPSIMHIDLSD